MKNKCKKLIATLVLGVTLCGSVLTVHAQCNHTGGTPQASYTVYSDTKTHTDMYGNKCQYRIATVYGTVYCTKCHVKIAENVKMSSYEVHSVAH